MRQLLLPAIMLFFAACNGDSAESVSSTAPAVDPGHPGKAMFQQNCATCHTPLRDMTGPALKGAVQRWDGDTARIKAFIRNPSKMIEQKDPRALAVYEQYKPTVMTAFQQLSDEDLDLIISYFENAR